MGLFDFLFQASKKSLIKEKYEYLCDKAYNASIKDDDISKLDENEKVFYVLYTFDLEFQNGGLCQFFVNSSREYAPLVSDYLAKVGAMEHKKIFDTFVEDNNINLKKLSFIEITDLADYKNVANSYPFKKFDEEFGELPELLDYLEIYLKEKM